MARPNKIGLDYFPLDVDFFEDEKMLAISGEFAVKGEIITLRLLCEIYRNGYFVEYSELLKNKLARLGGLSSGLVDEVVSKLVKYGFFDGSLFSEQNILTSKGIQERFIEVVKRRKMPTPTLFWINVDINPPCGGVNVDINPGGGALMSTETTQSKVKESKVKESKIKEKDKKEIFDFSFVADFFKIPFSDWLEYKRLRKESYKTQKSLEACYRRLVELSGNDPIKAVKIVERSLANNWAGLFELPTEAEPKRELDPNRPRLSLPI